MKFGHFRRNFGQGLTMRDTRITYLCVQQQPEVALSIC